MARRAAWRDPRDSSSLLVRSGAVLFAAAFPTTRHLCEFWAGTRRNTAYCVGLGARRERPGGFSIDINDSLRHDWSSVRRAAQHGATRALPVRSWGARAPSCLTPAAICVSFPA